MVPTTSGVGRGVADVFAPDASLTRKLVAGATVPLSGVRCAVVPFAESDDHGRVKLNPLADWSWNDVWHYIATHDVPYNPLHDRDYPSIGCWPSMTRVMSSAEMRTPCFFAA